MSPASTSTTAPPSAARTARKLSTYPAKIGRRSMAPCRSLVPMMEMVTAPLALVTGFFGGGLGAGLEQAVTARTASAATFERMGANVAEQLRDDTAFSGLSRWRERGDPR